VPHCSGPQLVALGQHAAAAQMFLGVDMVREAVDALIAAGEWGKAKRIAQQLEPK
jgi:intraflagellar transport protein 172